MAGKRGNKRVGKGEPKLHPAIRKHIWVVACMAGALLFILSAAGQAGPVGATLYKTFDRLFGWGYYLFPAVLFILAVAFIGRDKLFAVTTVAGAALFILAGLGMIDIVSPKNGGLTGELVGALETPFGAPAALVIVGAALIASGLVVVNRPLGVMERIKEILSRRAEKKSSRVPVVTGIEETEREREERVEEGKEEEEEEKKAEPQGKRGTEARLNVSVMEAVPDKAFAVSRRAAAKDYEAPPLKLLNSSVEKPTSGDLKAGANIIQRTLQSFDIPVEMGEIQVGPTVTRYTLKPAEGVRISRITALGQDLALALAAHPIRIEAPIPGKSLVGIEVPNKAAALVRLGSLIALREFAEGKPLAFALGRAVSGAPVFANIGKMPHLLIAGSTGSGKSIAIHSLITSLLFKNGPADMQLILIDPKRVELSIYEGIPHLVSPVITENKRAVGALKWAITEMERRYEELLAHGVRDIEGFHTKEPSAAMPYVIIVIDELADLMSSYGREVEGAIVRLAQMSRAVGLHLVVSTQRPSVEVITGLIKANIPTRVALQVASQIDSRTILDAAGAEKLLGNGDMLYSAAEGSRRERIQGAYLTEKEIKTVVAYIKEHVKPAPPVEGEVPFTAQNGASDDESGNGIDFSAYEKDGEEDELYEEAVTLVKEAKKASASLLQRRLRVGYARAARLLDMMEERGLIGPQDGAKPRDVYEQ